MPPMEKEQFVNYINELLNNETSLERRTVISTELFEQHEKDWNEHNSFNEEIKNSNEKISDLSHAYAVSMRKLGMTVTNQKEEEQRLSHSETVTLSDIEK